MTSVTTGKWVASTMVAASALAAFIAFATTEAGASSPTPPPAPPAQAPPPGMPPQKAAVWQQPESARVAHAGHPVVAPATPADPMFETMPSGITDSRQGPFTPQVFEGVNSWVGDVGGDTTVVVAGGVPTDAANPYDSKTLAGVYVYVQSMNPAPGNSGAQPGSSATPTHAPNGEFSITGANGADLTLQLGGSSTTYSFNAVTRTFSVGG